ncbi:hypothetical protein BGW36DRAFT_445682 [Talaromyces proteolyticus]|uniref:Uncharacterized protein n=1 Tax=Talaromyces proteolyticus TaxID=1131652 RepID=A0AAD4Q1A1_9EURO|nr:uncharacterized protein BGW36DRAFT_445682 [Talaromyces proteolyticus]KAH8702064.1 hypothetical protein BGW36DRAFT_445682 [Talaromyces proteolyticus]
MPPHSLYLLQLLNMDIFTIFKCRFGYTVKDWIYYDINYINKYDFLIILLVIRAKIYSIRNIMNSFFYTNILSRLSFGSVLVLSFWTKPKSGSVRFGL